ncbi:MAG: MarR family transcriptional regulator [Clostridia bacterium]|nr:MarR family transcriptional regulator [Clostridia bacterium]
MDALGNELNRLLVDTYRAAGKIEQVMLEDLSGGKLSMSEMRAIECIGNGRQLGRTVTEISQELDITLPSVTAMVKRLEKKGYLIKQRGSRDARQVNIRLTDDGYHAYVGYLFVQRRMINAVRNSIQEEDVNVLISSLKGLNEFFSHKMADLKQ